MANDPPDQNSQNMIDYLEQGKNNPSHMQEFKDNPIGVLQSFGIPVEDEFSEAVTKELKAFADLVVTQSEEGQPETMKGASSHAQSVEATVPTAPTILKIEQIKQKEITIPSEVTDALGFRVKPWGLVLVVREPAIKYIKGGGVITDLALTTVAGAAGIAAKATALTLVAVGGPIVAAIMVFLAGFLAWNLAWIEIMDEGKGVYITLTWAHILICGVGVLVPAITPIK